jgi:parallel beta helix pectate lyase-like protein
LNFTEVSFPGGNTMNTRRSYASSRNRPARSKWLSLALAALLALPPAAFAAPWGTVSARSLGAHPAVAPSAPAGLIYTVNTTGDAPGSGLVGSCDVDPITPGEQCTLRAALRATNGVAGEDTITFNIPLTQPGCDATTGKCVINLTQALPDITDGVSITGPGADKLTVRRDTGGDYRIFHVTTINRVTISRMTISNGRKFGFGEAGAGISIDAPAGTFNISNCAITGNSAGGQFSHGGGIGIVGSGTVNVSNCIISGNLAGSDGGGIYANGGTLTVTNSTITGNSVTGFFFPDQPFPFPGVGGGISNAATDGTVSVINSAISNNSSLPPIIIGNTHGGGISNQGTLNVIGSTISDNSVTADGGGIIQHAFANANITDSTIRGNSARAGGGIFNSGILNVTRSTISGNSAPSGSGGGIHDGRNSLGISVDLTNSTLSGNSAATTGGGIQKENFGIMRVTNSTLAGNNAATGGGGIFKVGSGTVEVKSSVVALNTGSSSSPDVLGAFTTRGFNLIGNADGSTGFTQPTDQTGTEASPLDPGFETDSFGLPLLKDNGGPTHTIALLSTSPAIDKGTADGLTGMLTTDQRGPGFPRTVDNSAIPPATGGDNTDIGAFEFAPPPLTAGNALLINESCPPANGAIDPGERVTVNLELINTGSAATSNLVATLQSSSGVMAPSGPQNYGAISVNSSAARDFSFTVPGNVSSGQTISATLQLQDGTTNLGTVNFNFTAGPAPCSFVRLVVSSSLSRADASTVVGAIMVQNIGSLPANDVTLNTAKLGTTNGTPLPQGLGNLAPGESATVMVNFSNSTPGSSSMLSVGGTYAGGTFSSNKRVTIP